MVHSVLVSTGLVGQPLPQESPADVAAQRPYATRLQQRAQELAAELPDLPTAYHRAVTEFNAAPHPYKVQNLTFACYTEGTRRGMDVHYDLVAKG